MSKKEIDIIREFVEIGFNEIKEETRNGDKVLSFTELKNIIVNHASYKDVQKSDNYQNFTFTDGKTDNGDIKSNVRKVYEDYEKKMKLLKDELQYEESGNASTENSSEDFLKAAIVLSSIAFNIILIKLYLDGDFRLLQLCGGIVIIIALTDASYRVIDLLNYSVKNGNENAELHKNALKKLKKIGQSGKDNHIFEFLKIYFDIENTSKNSHVKSKQVVEHFLRNQENFMLKSENMGTPNKKYTDRFVKFYDFMKNTDITKELVHKYGKKQDDHSYTRTHLYQTFDKNDMIETFKELYKKATDSGNTIAALEDDSSDNSKSGDYTDSYYKALFDNGGDTPNNTKGSLITAIESLCNLLENLKPESEYTKEFNELVKINNAFEILRLSNLPEYEQLCNQYFYKGLPEFKNILHEKDRYNIPDEYDSLNRLKSHLSSCDAFSKGYIKDICEVNKNKDIVLKERVTKTVSAILSKVVDDSKYLEVLVEGVMEFNHKAKTDVILKSDLLNGKYEHIIDIYERVFKKVFEHSGVKRIDMISFFNEMADKDFPTEANKGKNLFKHNGRKVLDVIFDIFDRNEEDLKLINTTPDTMDKTKYITYDQYLQKMTSYDDDELKRMYDNLDMIHKDMDNIITGYRSGKTKDDSTSIKINILKDMVHYYIASSVFFILDYFISLFVDSYADIRKNNEIREEGRKLASKIYELGNKGTTATKTAAVKGLKATPNAAVKGIKATQNAAVNTGTAIKNSFEKVKKSFTSKNNPQEVGLTEEVQTEEVQKGGTSALKRKTKGGTFAKKLSTLKEAVKSGLQNTVGENSLKIAKQITNGDHSNTGTENGKPGEQTETSSQSGEQSNGQEQTNQPNGNNNQELPFTLLDKMEELELQIKDKKDEIEKCREKSNVSDDETPKENETVCDAKKRTLESLKTQLKQLKDKFAKERSKTYENGMRFMTVFSIWILSVVLLYSFWMKSDSDYNYNEMIAINNSLKMRETLEKMKKHSKDAYVDKRNRQEHLRLLYESTKELLVVQGKCNLTKQNQGVVFPTSDVFIGVTIIGVCIMVILTNNMLNNPFDVMNKVKLIKQVMANEEEIKKEINVQEDIHGVIYDSLKVKEDFLKLLLKTTDEYDRVMQDLRGIQSLKNKYYSDLTLEQSMINIKRKQPNIWKRMEPSNEQLDKLKEQYDSLIEPGKDSIYIKPSMFYNIIENHPESWFDKENGLKDKFGTINYVPNSGLTLFDEKKQILSKFLQDNNYNEVLIWVKHYMNNKPTENDKALTPHMIIEQTINESEDPTQSDEPTKVITEYRNHTETVEAPKQKRRTQFLTDDHKKTAQKILNMQSIENGTDMRTDDFNKLKEDASIEFDKKVMPYIREALKTKNDELKKHIRTLDNEVIIPYTTTKFTERKTLSDQDKKVGVEYKGMTGGGGFGHHGGSTFLSTNNNNNMSIDLDNIINQYDTSEASETLDKLRGIDMSLIDMEKIEPIVNTSVSFSIFMLAIFMSYKIMNNAIKYKVELFNGKLFGESICM